MTIYANDHGDLLELMDPFHFVDRNEKILIECVTNLEITEIYPCALEKNKQKKQRNSCFVFQLKIIG